MKFIYGIIAFGDWIVKGEVTDYEYSNNGATVAVQINGTWYKTGMQNVLLMDHKPKRL